LHHEWAGRVSHLRHIGQLNAFFDAIRRHGWDDPPSHRHLPRRGLSQATQPPAPRTSRTRHGPDRRPSQPRPVGQPGLAADHHDPDQLRLTVCDSIDQLRHPLACLCGRNLARSGRVHLTVRLFSHVRECTTRADTRKRTGTRDRGHSGCALPTTAAGVPAAGTGPRRDRVAQP
jgi:hypothetical protein